MKADSVQMGEAKEGGIGLALSGGGFRATLFHLGALWRLNQMAMLTELRAVSSVSGGSLLAGLLATRWRKLTFRNEIAENFEEEITLPILKFCGRNIDVKSTLLSIFTGTRTLEGFYGRHLVGKTTLQDLPDCPEFIFNAYHLETGRNWTFSKNRLHTWRIGDIERPNTPMSKVLAASSAFPPFLPPVRLRLEASAFQETEYSDHFHESKLREIATLGDGGVYDNLGLHGIRQMGNILVSDASSPLKVDTMPRWRFWTTRVTRAIDTAVEQTRALRRSQLMEQLTSGQKNGALWTLTTNPQRYTAERRFEVNDDWRVLLGSIGTRMSEFSENQKCWLINWGYVQADLAIRSYFRKGLQVPEQLPFPEYGFSMNPAA